MWQRFSTEARQIIFMAEQEAEKAGKMVTSTEHILLAIWEDQDTNGSKVLARLGISKDSLVSEIAKLEPDPVGKKPRERSILSRDAKQAIEKTYQEALRMKERYIRTEHLLLGLISQPGAASKVLSALGVDLEKAREVVKSMAPAQTE